MLHPARRDLPLQSPAGAGYTSVRPNRKQIAAAGEQLVCDYYLTQGYVLLEKNWRSGRFGEVDLIMKAPGSELLTFIEVKTRRLARSDADRHDSGLASIDWRKRRQLLMLVRSYVARSQLINGSATIEVVIVHYLSARLVDGQASLQECALQRIPDAFDRV